MKIKLTSEEKIGHYQWVLENFKKSDLGPFLCNMLADSLSGKTMDVHSVITDEYNGAKNNLFELFPEFKEELIKYKSVYDETKEEDLSPYSIYNVDNSVREYILKRCIDKVTATSH